MRPWLIAVIAVVALVLGAVQVLSTLALRDAAQPGSWVRLVPAGAAARGATLDPRSPLPAAVQVLSTLALRDAAQPGSWVRLVPADAAARVDTLDPRIPLPAALRIVFAR